MSLTLIVYSAVINECISTINHPRGTYYVTFARMCGIDFLFGLCSVFEKKTRIRFRMSLVRLKKRGSVRILH